jgi:hypothetical membrane protein
MVRTALVGIGVFLVVMLALPPLEEGYSAMTDSVSEGALGRFGAAQTVAFLVLGLTSLAFALLVRRQLPRRSGTVAAVLFGVWALGVLLCGIFPVDRGAAGSTGAAQVHLLAALVAFVAALAGMWVLSISSRTHPGWAPRRGVLLALAAAATVGFVVMGAAPQEGSWGGLAQRVFVVLVLGWMAVAALTSTPARQDRQRAGAVLPL